MVSIFFKRKSFIFLIIVPHIGKKRDCLALLLGSVNSLISPYNIILMCYSHFNSEFSKINIQQIVTISVSS